MTQSPASRVILVNKPYGVLSQFTGESGVPTLAGVVPVPGVYPAGRLDADSEGLMVLTNDGALQATLSTPRHKQPKTYLALVEGIPTDEALRHLREGVRLGDYTTQPAQARRTEEPAWLWPRQPPVRFRAQIPTSWIELILTEGKNRQVRRMTAAAGFPTLRLIRYAIGPWTLDGLAPGAWRDVEVPADLAGRTNSTKRKPASRRVFVRGRG